MVDIHIQGHPDPEHALETPLPSRQGTRARFVAFRLGRRVLRLARVRISLSLSPSLSIARALPLSYAHTPKDEITPIDTYIQPDT